jgi:hypothetical protein
MRISRETLRPGLGSFASVEHFAKRGQALWARKRCHSYGRGDDSSDPAISMMAGV